VLAATFVASALVETGKASAALEGYGTWHMP
jgi:hypothetical protein